MPAVCSSGKQYWEYEFQQQPSQEDCEGSSLSTVFERFALLHRGRWDNIFELLFWDSSSGMEGEQVWLLSPESGFGAGLDYGGGGLRGEETGIVAPLIKSCLLWLDFASVDFWG